MASTQLPEIGAAPVPSRAGRSFDRRLWIVFAIVTLVVLLGSLFAGWRGRDIVMIFTALAASTVAGWTLTRYLVRHREHSLGGWRLADALLSREDAVAAEARASERAALAREMHDALGHQLTLVAVRAGALEATASRSAPSTAQIGELRAAAAQATDSLNDIVAMLADDGQDLRNRTDPNHVNTLNDVIERMIRWARAAGHEIRAQVKVDDSPDIGPVTLRALERLFEESLTNVARHAPGAEVTLSVRRIGSQIMLDAADTGPIRPPALSPGGGRGLTALAERVRLLGGTFEAGPEGEGFLVKAQLPIDARVGGPVPMSSARIERHRAELLRRRHRSWWWMVVAPAATALVGALIMISYVGFVTVASVLDPAGYRAVEIGQPSADARDALPIVQMLDPPGDAIENCRYHESTVSPFARDDVYEICFTGGVVASKRVIPPSAGS
jgi:signal transduction histidine kinase